MTLTFSRHVQLLHLTFDPVSQSLGVLFDHCHGHDLGFCCYAVQQTLLDSLERVCHDYASGASGPGFHCAWFVYRPEHTDHVDQTVRMDRVDPMERTARVVRMERTDRVGHGRFGRDGPDLDPADPDCCLDWCSH